MPISSVGAASDDATDAAPTELIAYPILNYKHGAPTEREAELGSLWEIVFVDQLTILCHIP